MGLGQVRLQLQCPAVVGDRFVRLSHVLQGKSQVVERLGQVRFQLQGPAVTGDCLGIPAQGPIRFPQVAVEGSRIPVQGNRPPNVFDGALVFTQLVGYHAEKMDHARVIRIDGENLPVDLLGGLQPSGLMMLDRSR